MTTNTAANLSSVIAESKSALELAAILGRDEERPHDDLAAQILPLDILKAAGEESAVSLVLLVRRPG